MFALCHNLYKFFKKRSERKITLALLGLDNAGKTTLLNTIQGEVEKDTTPTFGFNSSTLQEGKYTIEVFDLGGGKNIRGVWRKYLAEVHAIIYVVDAADAPRFEEAKATMQEVLDSPFMRDKPILLYANKQDLPAAAAAAEVVKSLGLGACRNSHNVVACTAKTPAGADVDARLRDGLRWLVGCVDRDFARLGPRVLAEGDEVRQEEARKKKEREERLRRQREERARAQKAEEEERAREVEKENELHDGQAPSVLVATVAADASGATPHGQSEPHLKLQQQHSLQHSLEHSLQPQLPQQQQPQLLESQQQKQPLPPHLIHGLGLALGLPHTIESPGSKLPPPRNLMPPTPPSPSSDLRVAKLDQSRSSAPPPPLAAAASSRARISSGGGMPPSVRAPTGLSALPPPHASASGAGPRGTAGAVEDAVALVPSSSGGWAASGPVTRRSGSARSGSSNSTSGGGGGGGSGRPASGMVGTRESSGTEAGEAGRGGDGSDDRGGGSSMGAARGQRRLGGTSGGASNQSEGGGGHRGSFSRGPQNNKVVPVVAEQLLGTVTG